MTQAGLLNTTPSSSQRRPLPLLAAALDATGDVVGDSLELVFAADGSVQGLFMPVDFCDALGESGVAPAVVPERSDFWTGYGGARSLSADLKGLYMRTLDMMRDCIICEYRCHTDRTAPLDKRTVCMVGTESVIRRIVPLGGEEPEIAPSNAVFYSGCAMRCTSCHSADFSHRIQGTRIAPVDIVDSLLAAGTPRTIQFVGGNPDHHILSALEIIEILRGRLGHDMPPIVWNTNFYLSPEALALLTPVVDVWVVDVKWILDSCARRDGKVPSVLARSGEDRRYASVMFRNLALLPDDVRVIVRHVPDPAHALCCTPLVRAWAAGEPLFGRAGAFYHEPPFMSVRV